MIRIAHISDTHDFATAKVAEVANLDAEVILITGDAYPNRGRIDENGIVPELEVAYQQAYVAENGAKWAEAIGDRPVIAVRGNHDFIGFGWLRDFGIEVFEITDETPMVEVMGKRFAGFRQVPYIQGEWAGEQQDMQPFVDKAFACNPDILVTHAPAAGILDTDTHGGKGYGIGPLTTALAYMPHNVTHHFFGHAHKGFGKVEEMGITFVNGAGHCTLHVI